MANIYLRQMHELNVDVEKYSKLLDAPIFIVRRLVKGETLSEDMGLNEFIRNNILKKYNELEKNKVETQSKVIALKIDVDKKQNDLLEWYKNEFDKNVLMEKYNCNKILHLYRKIPLTTEPRYKNGKHFSSNEIISETTFDRLMNKKNISLEFLMPLLEQLKKYYDSEIKENVVKEDFTKNKKTRLENWWENFDLKEWLVKNDISVRQFTSETHIGHVSYYNIINKTHKTSLSNIKKINNYVKEIENKNNIMYEEDVYDKKTTSENQLLKWHKDFNYQDFMKKNNLTNNILFEELKLGRSTISAITSPLKKYSPADEIIKKVKEYVESFEEKEEKMKEIEIIGEDIIETHCETNTNKANSNEIEKLDTFIEKEEKCENECLNDVLKNILKDRLTDEERKLIEIFGGKIC